MLTTMRIDINQAVTILRAGGLVVFPTETVYGLGADASNPTAVRRVFEAKERPYNHPLIVHLLESAWLEDWALDITDEARKLAKAFWPGPLTMVFNKQSHVLDLVTADQPTVALRVPRHPLALSLLNGFGDGLVAPSANRFTRISPTTASAVQQELGGRVDMILDGGPSEVGLESTIVDMSRELPVILRPGMISAKAISEVVGRPISYLNQDQPVVRVPGMHAVHYAPATKTMLLDFIAIKDRICEFDTDLLPLAILSHSNLRLPKVDGVKVVRLPSDPDGYARALYRTLREQDQQQLKRIIIEDVPQSAEWAAVRDRIVKASEPA